MKTQLLNKGFGAEVSAARSDHYVLRLFVTGSTSKSQSAIRNITAICTEYLHEKYDLEVIDMYQTPALPNDSQIFAIPTLVKQLPLPERRIIGDLSDRDAVLFGLDLKCKI
jgi:circadian clock protein KaiB